MKKIAAILVLVCLLLPTGALAATEYVAASYGYTTNASGAPVCWTGNVTYLPSLEVCRTKMAELKATAAQQNLTLAYPDECKAVTERNNTIRPDKNLPDCATYRASGSAPTTPAAEPAAPSTDSGGFVPLTKIQNVEFAGNADQLPAFLNSIYMICIGLAAVIGVLQIMRAGVTWMTAAGSHEKIGEAKNLVRDTIIGIVLVLAPTIVFSIINPKILSLQIGGIEDLKTSSRGSTLIEPGSGASGGGAGGSGAGGGSGGGGGDAGEPTRPAPVKTGRYFKEAVFATEAEAQAMLDACKPSGLILKYIKKEKKTLTEDGPGGTTVKKYSAVCESESIKFWKYRNAQNEERYLAGEGAKYDEYGLSCKADGGSLRGPFQVLLGGGDCTEAQKARMPEADRERAGACREMYLTCQKHNR